MEVITHNFYKNLITYNFCKNLILVYHNKMTYVMAFTYRTVDLYIVTNTFSAVDLYAVTINGKPWMLAREVCNAQKYNKKI